jgi:2,3-bisphosphoglycerate-independent phosphoglycerate mutase
MKPEKYESLINPAGTKIIMLIIDGLGGLPRELKGKTELETAHTPNLDALAEKSSLGLTIPIAPGVTPGSGPAHLALFGYDPLENEIGRGALEALGVDFELGPDDLAARGNYCTLDAEGLITDRRAGRIDTEKNQELSSLLSTIELDGAEIFIEPIKEHRFAVILRASDLQDSLTDSDPQKTGVKPSSIRALRIDSEKSARLVNRFIHRAGMLLADKHPANMILLRGFTKLPILRSFQMRYGLKAAAIAINGMYKGVARLVGMQILPVPGQTLQDEINVLENNWNDFDFFYLHIKKTDTLGELGDFNGKVIAIEEVDSYLLRVLSLNPNVLVIGGDHSSPAVLKSHSWHPVPLLLNSPFSRPDGIKGFGERNCSRGSLGTFPATQLMPLVLANALRFIKYGA